MQELEISEQERQELVEECRKQRVEFIEKNTPEWIQIGKKYKEMRLAYGITLAKMSRKSTFSSTKLRNFETGLPVRNSAAIERIYELVFQLADQKIQAAHKEVFSI